jgi:hypothetical protein
MIGGTGTGKPSVQIKIYCVGFDSAGVGYCRARTSAWVCRGAWRGAVCYLLQRGGADRAVALLRSFQFSRAIAGSNVVLSNDPTCGMAYWGIALSDSSNPFVSGVKDKMQLRMGRENADHGKALSAKTERERAYIAAVLKLLGGAWRGC